jgi:hypothetical protein
MPACGVLVKTVDKLLPCLCSVGHAGGHNPFSPNPYMIPTLPDKALVGTPTLYRLVTPQERTGVLRVLAEYDTTYKTHVAYCLETGSVVTAENAEDLKSMIKELLEDEISFAVANKNLTNLFSTPAGFDVFVKWQEAVEKNGVEDIPLAHKEDIAHKENDPHDAY